MTPYVWLLLVLVRWKCDAFPFDDTFSSACANRTDECIASPPNDETIGCDEARKRLDCLTSLVDAPVCRESDYLLHVRGQRDLAADETNDLCESSTVSTSTPNRTPSTMTAVATERPPSGCEWRNASRAIGAPAHSACLLFGDPHIVTFDNVEQTCAIPGVQRLLTIGDDVVSVEVENVRVSTTLKATATSRVIVEFAPNECTHDRRLRYVAENGAPLADEFVDGSSSGYLIERNDSNRVDIFASWANVRVRIRRFGMYFTVAVQLAEAERASAPSGLCHSGCPAKDVLSLDAANLKAAGNLSHFYACDAVDEDSFFFTSCVFDYKTTNNINFTEAARKAESDEAEFRINGANRPLPTLFLYLIPIWLVIYSSDDSSATAMLGIRNNYLD